MTDFNQIISHMGFRSGWAKKPKRKGEAGRPSTTYTAGMSEVSDLGDLEVNDLDDGMTIENILADKNLFYDFAGFVRESLAEENLYCLLDIDKENNDEFLFTEYLSATSHMTINISGSLSKDVQKEYESTQKISKELRQQVTKELKALLEINFLENYLEWCEQRATEEEARLAEEANPTDPVSSKNTSTNVSKIMSQTTNKRVAATAAAAASRKNKPNELVIIGGGFAGASIAAAMQEDPLYNVTLIDTKEFFEATPSIISTMIQPTRIMEMAMPHKQYLTKGKLVVGQVRSIRYNTVMLQGRTVPYDTLVIATGTHYPSNIKGSFVSLAYRYKAVRKEAIDIKAAKTIVIIGGGLVGVEYACEIKAAYKEKNVIMLHRNVRLMPRWSKKTHTIALKKMKKIGVDVRLKTEVTGWDSKKSEFQCADGSTVSCDKALWCAGVIPNSKFMNSHFKGSMDDKGYMKVNACLQLQVPPQGDSNGVESKTVDEEQTNSQASPRSTSSTNNMAENLNLERLETEGGSYNKIFCVGDCNDTPNERSAQNACNQASTTVENLKRSIRGRPLVPYKIMKWYEEMMFISTGPREGIRSNKANAFTVAANVVGLKWWTTDFTLKRILLKGDIQKQKPEFMKKFVCGMCVCFNCGCYETINCCCFPSWYYRERQPQHVLEGYEKLLAAMSPNLIDMMPRPSKQSMTDADAMLVVSDETVVSNNPTMP